MTYGPKTLGKGKGHPPNYYPVRPQVLSRSTPLSLVLTYRVHSKGVEQGWIRLDQSEAICCLRPMCSPGIRNKEEGAKG